MTVDLDKLRERWLIEGAESDLGLWWLADDLREAVGYDTDETEIRRLTLETLRPLLESKKLHAVTLLEGGEFEPWIGDVDSHIRRIESEWKKLGGSPRIGDVVWFIGERG